MKKSTGVTLSVLFLFILAGCGRTGLRTVFFGEFAITPYIISFDEDRDAGYFLSLAFDYTARPHISYMDFTGMRLIYATPVTGSGPQGPWLRTVVDSSGIAGAYSCIVTDDLGYPHIIYATSTDEGAAIKHAWIDSGSGKWQIVTLRNVPAGFISCEYGINGWIHVAYIQLDDYNLRYMIVHEDNVSIEDRLIDMGGSQAGGTGQLYWTDIAVDISNRPHIVYYDAINGNTKYVSKTAFGDFYDEVIEWRLLDEEVTFENVSEPNLVVALLTYPSSGRKEDTHVYAWLPGSNSPSEITSTYWDFYQNDRRRIQMDKTWYSSYPSGTTFSVSYLDTTSSPNDDGFFSAVAIDPEGRVHVAYFDYTTWDLKYAVKEEGRWKIETVDGEHGEAVGAGLDMALTDKGEPFIIYRDMWNKSVKGAFRPNGGDWIVGEIYSPPDLENVEFTGFYPHIAKGPFGDFGAVFREWRYGNGTLRGVVVYLDIKK